MTLSRQFYLYEKWEREWLTFCLSAELVVTDIKVIAPKRNILVPVIFFTWNCDVIKV